MKKILLILFISSVFFTLDSFAQSPNGKDFGFGIIVGDPTGGTIKVWTMQNNAFVVSLGASYFGSPRINFDYLWHFDAFNSRLVKLYAGPGAVIGFGEGKGFWYEDKYDRNRNELGIGARGLFGVNVVPDNTPLEFFFEIGVLLGFTPEFGSAADAALGMRFYP